MFIDEVDRAVAGSEGGQLVASCNQTDLHSLPDTGVRLLRFNAYLFDDDALCLGRTTEWIRLFLELQNPPFVASVLPPKPLTVPLHLGTSKESPTHAYTLKQPADLPRVYEGDGYE